MTDSASSYPSASRLVGANYAVDGIYRTQRRAVYHQLCPRKAYRSNRTVFRESYHLRGYVLGLARELRKEGISIGSRAGASDVAMDKEQARLSFCPIAFSRLRRPAPTLPDGSPRPKTTRFCNFKRFCPFCWARAVAAHGEIGEESIRAKVYSCLFPLGAATKRKTRASHDVERTCHRYTFSFEGGDVESIREGLADFLDDLQNERFANQPALAADPPPTRKEIEGRAGWVGTYRLIAAQPDPTDPRCWEVELRRLNAYAADTWLAGVKARGWDRGVLLRPMRTKLDKMIARFGEYPRYLLYCRDPQEIPPKSGARPRLTPRLDFHPNYTLLAAYFGAVANKRLWEAYGKFRNERAEETKPRKPRQAKVASNGRTQ